MSEFNRSGCEGKHRFDSRKLALNVARRSSHHHSVPINAYRCEWCGGWHVGQRGKPKIKRPKYYITTGDFDD